CRVQTRPARRRDRRRPGPSGWVPRPGGCPGRRDASGWADRNSAEPEERRPGPRLRGEARLGGLREPHLQLADGPLGILALVLVETVQEQDAVEVVELVLDHAGEELVGLEVDR